MTPLEEIGAMADVPISIDVELDRKVMRLREILELDAGSVVKMSRSAGENISIFSGAVLVGFGEIVIIEEAVGIRITDFVEEGSP